MTLKVKAASAPTPAAKIKANTEVTNPSIHFKRTNV